MDPQIVTIICYVIIGKLKYRTVNIIVFVTLKEEVKSADYTDTAKRLWMVRYQGLGDTLYQRLGNSPLGKKTMGYQKKGDILRSNGGRLCDAVEARKRVGGAERAFC
jgi:hypothetical protein